MAAMTPEGRTKRAIRAILNRYADQVYTYMPVPAGYGVATLDYLGFAAGHGFAIEAKRERGKPTPRQDVIIQQMRAAGAKVFIINGPEALQELDDWLAEVTTTSSEP